MLGAVSMHAGRVLCTSVHHRSLILHCPARLCAPRGLPTGCALAVNLWPQLSDSLGHTRADHLSPHLPILLPPTSLLPTELPPCLPCAPWPRPRVTVGPLGQAVRGLAAALPPVAWVWTL